MSKLDKLGKAIKGFFSELQKNKTAEEVQAVPQVDETQEIRDESVHSGQELSDALEELKGSLPGYGNLGEEKTRTIVMLLEKMQKMIAGQHAEVDVSDLDKGLEHIARVSVPFLLSLEELYSECVKSLSGLADAIKSRAGTEAEVRLAKVKSQIVMLETERTRLSMDEQKLSSDLAVENTTLGDLGKKMGEGVSPELAQMINAVTSNIGQITAQKTSITQELRSVEEQLGTLKRQQTLIDIEKGTMGEDVRKIITRSISEYQGQLMELHKKATAISESVAQQRSRTDAVMKVIRQEQKEAEYKNVLTEEAERLLHQTAAQTVEKTETAETEKPTAELTQEN